jgi:FAD/FMN-containing dehydrogenase
MPTVRSVAAAAAELGDRFTGTLLKPGDAGYDAARRVHNGLVDKRPALIAQCRTAADVTSAIELTQTLGLEVAVRGGGHNVAGRGTIDGGVLIDLAPLRSIPRTARCVRRAGSPGRSSIARRNGTASP